MNKMKDIPQNEPAYWENTYKDLIDGVVFRFKKMNPIEHLNLVTKNVDFERLDGDNAEYFIKKCLQMTLWTKDNVTWNTLVDSEGNAKLPELERKMSAALDLFYYFKKDVLLPVFFESKTFQKFTTDEQVSSSQTSSGDQEE